MRFCLGTLAFGLLATSMGPAMRANALAVPGGSAPVLVELFTSEGCSSCPPADELLRQVNGQRSSQDQVIIGLSEHVTYWNQLGWKDPFSAEQFTARQNDYSNRLHTEGPYTPQMVVNGREQFVGSDGAGLRVALKEESARSRGLLKISEAKVIGEHVSFSYSIDGNPEGKSLLVMAAVVDDADRSSVQRGENAGRSLEHVFVVRTLREIGSVSGNGQKTASIPLPAELIKGHQGHHLVLFLQWMGLGAVEAVDTKAF